jgi:hypothetical protein
MSFDGRMALWRFRHCVCDLSVFVFGCIGCVNVWLLVFFAFFCDITNDMSIAVMQCRLEHYIYVYIYIYIYIYICIYIYSYIYA